MEESERKKSNHSAKKLRKTSSSPHEIIPGTGGNPIGGNLMQSR